MSGRELGSAGLACVLLLFQKRVCWAGSAGNERIEVK